MLCRERRVARSLFRARQKARCKPFPAIGTECDVFLLVRERAFSGCFAGHIPRAKEPADQDHGRICTAGDLEAIQAPLPATHQRVSITRFDLLKVRGRAA